MFRHLSTTTASAIAFGIVVVLVIALVSGEGSEEETDPNDISHGLGNDIAWKTLDEGLSLSKDEKKPLMIIIHKSWCGACRSLIPKVRESKEIEEISTNFIMVNTQDNDEPVGDMYKPDGGYVPRILFFNPEGSLLEDVINEDGNPQYKYYYYDAESMLNSMKKVSNMFSDSSNENSEEKDDPSLNKVSGNDKSEL